MKKIALFSLALTLGLGSLSSCKKYEDDTMFMTLRTPSNRLTGDWKLTQTSDKNDANPQTGETEGGTIIFSYKKDGVFTYTFSFSGNTQTVTGTWKLTDDKKQISMTVTSGTETDTLLADIKQLSNKKMKLYFPDDQSHYYFDAQ
jgi:hypothetical protein